MPLIWLGEQFVFTQNPLVRQVAIYTNAIILGTSTAVVESSPNLRNLQQECNKYKDRYPKRSKVIVLNRETHKYRL